MGRYYSVDGKQYYGEHVSRLVGATGAWATGATLGDIQLDKDFLITNVILQAAMTATLTATAVIDAPKRSLQGLSIIGDSKTFLAMLSGVAASQAGRLLALLNQFDHQGAALDANADVGATGFNQFYNYHPGHNPRDPFDLSVCIPARALSNLIGRIVCPLAAAPDAGGNFTAGTYTFLLEGVSGVPISKRMFYPGGWVETYPHTAAVANYGNIHNVPTGGYVRRLVIMADNNAATAAVRADAQVTGVQVKISKDSTELITTSFLGLKYRNAMRYGVVGDQQPAVLGAIATTRPGYNGAMHQPVGFAVVDFRDYFDPVLGLNMVGAQEGDVKCGLTIGVATGQTLLYWDIVYPMEPSWVGK